ncbi:hypothetical protein ElyMa_005562600 [Elysia marginata]|uniref:Uncharacterized protein n=1 Tax=Elysia marginata TaxID=1093978 RepID=A0AAV4F0P2_9GAST|nr:hypothetical protein ElyMa_005562600 [Elysia marginata]
MIETFPYHNLSSGRLGISTVDGVRTDGLIDKPFTFGGRGFSIHLADNLGIGTTTVDSFEKVTKQYMSDVFNTAYTGPSSNPQADREATSPFLVNTHLYTITYNITTCIKL